MRGPSASNTNVSGTWSGQISGPGGTSPLTLQLTQTDLDLNGTLRLGEGQLAVSGTLAGNLVSLSGQAGSETLQLVGSVSDSTMQGQSA